MVNDTEGIVIFLQRLFRFREPFAILFSAVFTQALFHRLKAVVVHPIAQKRVHRSVEEIRHPYEQQYVRHVQPRFPFVYRADGHAEHLGKLLLRQPPFLAQRADIARKSDLHPLFSFAFIISL